MVYLIFMFVWSSNAYAGELHDIIEASSIQHVDYKFGWALMIPLVIIP